MLILNAHVEAIHPLRERLLALLKDTACELRVTQSVAEAGLWAREAQRRGQGRLIVGGGDGTIHHIVNALDPPCAELELAVLPLGTGNDFARSLGLPLDDLAQAVDLALHGRATPIDLIRITADQTTYLVNAASGGWGGKVAATVATLEKSRWGPFAYWMTAVGELMEIRPFKVQLEIDSRVQTESVYAVFVTNGRFVGGGFPIAPAARLDDGWLDITLVPVLPTLQLLAAGLNLMLWQPWNDPSYGLRCERGRRVRIVTEPEMHFSLDGEPTRLVELTFEVVPQAMRCVVGPDYSLSRLGAEHASG
jgi:diacylglycerol kinase (ATP)